MMGLKYKNSMLLFVFTIIAVLGAWHMFFRNDGFWSQLLERAGAGQSVIYFKEITPGFSWDTVCILEPYSLGSGSNVDKRIEQYIKADLGTFKNKIPHLNDDGLWAFAFIEQEKVIKIAQKKGSRFYLYKDYSDSCMKRDEVFFFIDGNNILIRAK